MKQCPKCHIDNPKAANFCRKCRYEFPEASKEGQELIPKIKMLQVMESDYVVGSVIHIEWEVEHYTNIELEGEDVTGYTNIELNVEKPTELYFVVKNDYTQVYKVLHISPSPMPAIRFFTASSQEISKGQQIILKWNVIAAKRLLLRDDNLLEWDVTSQNKIDILPSKSSRYTLVAISADDDITIEESIDVKVYDNVIIHSFIANPSRTIEAEPVMLQWKVDSAEKVILYPDGVDVTNYRSIEVYPKRDTHYRLVASNLMSTQEAMLTISVMSLPKVEINMPKSIERLKFPECNVDFAYMMVSIKDTNISRWMINQARQALPDTKNNKFIINMYNYLLRKIPLFHKSLKIFKHKLKV